jgi:hypothetical protein
MFQTDWQRKMFDKYGKPLLCIDATHNVTMYENLNLTTLVVRDRWKHGTRFSLCKHLATDGTHLTGIPIAWMLASNGTQATIYYFLKLHHLRNPLTIPRNIISDFDWGQINACWAAYHSFILLCWWHVLHSWQKHFHIDAHPELWDLLKRWLRMTEKSEFDAAWVKIQNIAPVSFVDYLKKYWMLEKVVRMWSGLYRTERDIFEACDTNMLIEAYVLGYHLPSLSSF